ncbi:DUF2065 domain-containing protein [Lysobacter fragariae]
MTTDLLSALCLVAVLEGLALFIAPRGWKQVAEQLLQMPSARLRLLGAAFVIAGLVSLYLVRGT